MSKKKPKTSHMVKEPRIECNQCSCSCLLNPPDGHVQTPDPKCYCKCHDAWWQLQGPAFCHQHGRS